MASDLFLFERDSDDSGLAEQDLLPDVPVLLHNGDFAAPGIAITSGRGSPAESYMCSRCLTGQTLSAPEDAADDEDETAVTSRLSPGFSVPGLFPSPGFSPWRAG
jgi:hypothetical protein